MRLNYSANKKWAFQNEMAASLDAKRRNAILVELQGTKVGLGIKIVGGHNHQNPQQAYGIYIKDIIREHLAHRNGIYCKIYSITQVVDLWHHISITNRQIKNR